MTHNDLEQLQTAIFKEAVWQLHTSESGDDPAAAVKRVNPLKSDRLSYNQLCDKLLQKEATGLQGFSELDPKIEQHLKAQKISLIRS